MSFQRINVVTAKTLIDEQNACVIDIRDAASFQSGHIEKAQLVHNDNIQEFLESADMELPLIVCCYHGNMSQGAADYFFEQGFTQSYSLDGGFTAWMRYQVE